jgi:ABC-2 type transport system permease protein
MIRYLRLYGKFLEFSFSRGFEFRFDFCVRIVMDIIYYIVNILFYKVIFSHTSLLAGWNEQQGQIFVAGYLLVDALIMAVFADNLFFLPTLIQNGDLDYYLVRPVSSLFFVSLRSFSSSSLINVLIALGFVGWTIAHGSEGVVMSRIPLFLAMLTNGAILHYIMAMFLVTLVFWSQSGRGLLGLAWSLSKFMEKPHGVFSGVLRYLLLTILPFSLMASLPASYLFGEVNGGMVLHISVVTSLLFGLMVMCWRLGLRNYTSASS